MDELRQKLTERAAQARKTANRAKKELDQKILELTRLHFEKIRGVLSERQKKWEADGDVIYRLAEKVLNRARTIRESLQTVNPTEKQEGDSKGFEESMEDLVKAPQSKRKRSGAAKKTRETATKMAASLKSSAQGKEFELKKAKSSSSRKRSKPRAE